MKDSANPQLLLHLTDLHALEIQSIKQLQRAMELADDADLYKEHLEETEEHEKLIRERIEAHDREPSPIKDLTMRSGAIGLRQLADIPPDTAIKLAMHFYALESLEVAAYEMLLRLAKDAGDDETVQVAEKILGHERSALEKIEGTFDRAVELTLEAQENEESSGDDSNEGSDDEERSEADAERTEAARA